MSQKATLERKQALSTYQQQHIVELSETGNFSLRQLAVLYGVSHMTIYRIITRSLGATPEQRDRPPANQQQTASDDTRSRIYSAYG